MGIQEMRNVVLGIARFLARQAQVEGKLRTHIWLYLLTNSSCVRIISLCRQGACH